MPGLVPRVSADAATAVVVDQVCPGSAAERAGIRPGERIERVNRQPVSSVSDLLDRLSGVPAGTAIELQVQGARGSRLLETHLGDFDAGSCIDPTRVREGAGGLAEPVVADGIPAAVILWASILNRF